MLAHNPDKWWAGWPEAHTGGGTRIRIGAPRSPQVGAALGMALVAASALPEHSTILMTVVISTSVLFELVGPIVTPVALRKADRYGSIVARDADRQSIFMVRR